MYTEIKSRTFGLANAVPCKSSPTAWLPNPMQPLDQGNPDVRNMQITPALPTIQGTPGTLISEGDYNEPDYTEEDYEC
jgi:hypothetical protein